MADLLLAWRDRYGDLEIANGDLETDDSLHSAVLVSLFTDARVTNEELPEGQHDRRGWWAQFGDNIGSKLWLLERSKRTIAVLELHRQYAFEALEWMVNDGIVSSIAVGAIYREGVAVLDITLMLQDQSQQDFEIAV